MKRYTFRLMIDSKSHLIGFARIELTFNPSLVNLTTEIQTTNSPLTTLVGKSSKSQANSTGKIIVVLALTPGDSAPTGIFELAQLSFRAVTSAANQTATLTFIDQNMQIVDTQPVPLPFTSQSTTLVLNKGQYLVYMASVIKNNGPGAPTPSVPQTPTPTIANTPTSTKTVTPTATRTATPTETPVSGCVDQFDSSSLNPAWTWVDPLGDSSYSLTANRGYLRLSTPDGNHDLYQNLNAPRLVRSVGGDFVATTKVAINPQYNYQGAGLLLWQDENNYVRLERTLVDGIDVWYSINGTYNGIQIPYAQSPVQLRLQRAGNTIKALYSDTGSSWKTATTITFPAANTLKLGLVLINQWQDNPIQADFDFFTLNTC